MRLRKAIRKIAALGAGATMVGATIMSAMALDLANYPAPFLSAGKFSGVLVVGDKAAAEDVIGVTDIATSLQYSATSASAGTGVSTIIDGDAWKVGSSSKKFELSENLDAGNNGETITNITTVLESGDLNSLADGEITNDKGTATYAQYLHFDLAHSGNELQSRTVLYTEDDDDVTSDFFYIKNGYQIARYEMEFKTSFDSDTATTSTGGTTSSTGTFLPDIEDEEISMFGNKYTIVKARRTVNGPNATVELTLMSGAVKDTLQEGETKTYTIDGKEYEVNVPIITDTGTTYVKFVINGETTKALQDGQSDKMSDGTEIGVREILPNEAGDVSQDIVEFYLGAKKLLLKDTIIADAASSDTVEYNNENIQEAAVIIRGSNTSSLLKIESIEINTTAEDDLYLAAGGKLSSLMDEPEALVAKSYDIEYRGLSSEPTNDIKVRSSGSKQYQLYFTDADGSEVKLPIARANSTSGTTLNLGDDENQLIMNSTTNINRKDYFVLTDESEAQGHRNSWAFQYMGADASTADNPVISFKNLGSGETIERPYTTDSGAAANYVGATLRMGGQTFDITNRTTDTAKNFDIRVELGGVTGLGAEEIVEINTQYGAVINLTAGGLNRSATAFENGFHVDNPQWMKVGVFTIHTDDYEDIVPSAIQFNISASTGEVRLGELCNLNLKSPEGESDTSYGYTSYGAFVKYDAPTGDPQNLDITYPKAQLEPLVYVTSGIVNYASAGVEGAESVSVSKIEVGATKLASEVVDTVEDQNVIAVGGPCANSVAAAVMGNPADCTKAANIGPGEGILALYDNGENVAMVIAGYDALDTRNAAQVVANFQDYALSGTSMKVSKVGTTLTVTEEDISPVMEEEAPVEEEPMV
ncbi:MAG: hypothetical protein ABIJ08_04335 [Nanoarchaeota archaeon]